MNECATTTLLESLGTGALVAAVIGACIGPAGGIATAVGIVLGFAASYLFWLDDSGGYNGIYLFGWSLMVSVSIYISHYSYTSYIPWGRATIQSRFDIDHLWSAE